MPLFQYQALGRYRSRFGDPCLAREPCDSMRLIAESHAYQRGRWKICASCLEGAAFSFLHYCHNSVGGTGANLASCTAKFLISALDSRSAFASARLLLM